MTQTVTVPGVGTLQFPDDMSQSDMQVAIHKNFPQLGAPPGQQQPANPTEGMSTAQKFLAGAGSTLSRWNNTMRQMNAGDAVNPETGEVVDQSKLRAAVQADILEQRQRDKPLMATTPGSLGAMAPNAALTLAGGIPGAAAGGALGGALEPTVEGDKGIMGMSPGASNTLMGAAGGAAGGLAGKALGVGLKAGASQLTDVGQEAVAFLKAHGVNLSLGQQTGTSIGQTADAALSQVKDLTTAALKYMGVTSDRASTSVMDGGRKVLQNTYDSIAARTQVQWDRPLQETLGHLEATAGDLLEPGQAKVINTAISKIRNMAMSNEAGAPPVTISGTAFKNLESMIGKIDGDGGKQPFVDGISSAMREAMARSASPADAQLLAQTNQRYGAMKLLEKAIGNKGIYADRIDPNKLAAAVDVSQNASASVYGRGANADLAQLGNYAGQIMGHEPAERSVGALAGEVTRRLAVGGILGYGTYGRTGSIGEGSALGIAAALGGPALARAAASNPAVIKAVSAFANKQGIRSAAEAAAYVARKGGQAAGGAAPQALSGNGQ
jgi:hypothetical protein